YRHTKPSLAVCRGLPDRRLVPAVRLPVPESRGWVAVPAPDVLQASTDLNSRVRLPVSAEGRHRRARASLRDPPARTGAVGEVVPAGLGSPDVIECLELTAVPPVDAGHPPAGVA